MPVQINDNGVLRLVHTLQVNDDGALRNIHTVQINDDGVLRNVYLGIVTLSGGSIGASGGRCTFILRSDGTTDQNEDGSVSQINASTDWIIPNEASAGAFWVRFTQTGNAFDVGTLNAWLATSSDREVGYSTAGGGTLSGTLTVQIATDSGGSNIVGSNSYQLITTAP